MLKFKKDKTKDKIIDASFTEEELENAIEIQSAQDKQRAFRQKLKTINRGISNSNLFKFTKGKVWPILAPFFLVMGVLVIIPLITIIIYAIKGNGVGDLDFSITLEKFFKMFTDTNVMIALLLSVAYAIVAGMICVVIGYPIALMMANMKSKIFARNMWVLVTLPIWISMLLKVLGLQTLFYLMGDSNPIGTPIAILIGMVYMFLPFAIIPIYDALESRDMNLEDAAQDLGASKLKTFWTITVRSSLAGVITAFTLVVIQASTSLVIVHFLGDGKVSMIAKIIESFFTKGSDFGYGAAISVVLTALVFAMMLISRAITNKLETKGGKRKWKNSSKIVTLP